MGFRVSGKTIAIAVASAVLTTPLLSWTTNANAAPRSVSVAAAPAAPAPPSLHPGDHGAEVRMLQQRLIALHYDPGAVTGTYGADTTPAVWAFQKVNHIKPTSTVGPLTWRALANPITPAPLIPRGASNRVEVDIKHQLLFLYKGGSLRLISHVSTGSNKKYYSNGTWETAYTPIGDFHVYYRIKGWRKSHLGLLYNPLYFYKGWAIHGEGGVPLHPASHGCVRIPMHTADVLPPLVPNGTAVYIR